MINIIGINYQPKSVASRPQTTIAIITIAIPRRHLFAFNRMHDGYPHRVYGMKTKIAASVARVMIISRSSSDFVSFSLRTRER